MLTALEPARAVANPAATARGEKRALFSPTERQGHYHNLVWKGMTTTTRFGTRVASTQVPGWSCPGTKRTW